MPCFLVVSYAFSRSKKMATTCSFLTITSHTKASNLTSGQQRIGSYEINTGCRINGPWTPGTTSVVRSPCTPWFCKDSWLAQWACSLWDSWDFYLGPHLVQQQNYKIFATLVSAPIKKKGDNNFVLLD